MSMGLEAGDVVLSITWHPVGLGGRTGLARVSHLDGRDDRRHMDRREALAMAISIFGDDPIEHDLTGQGVEWTRAPG
jgi:hypothetical protein